MTSAEKYAKRFTIEQLKTKLKDLKIAKNYAVVLTTRRRLRFEQFDQNLIETIEEAIKIKEKENVR